MKRVFIFFAVFFLLFQSTVFANSSYVLPYPSFMPGGISYKLHLLWEEVSNYWYFGDFGQFEYNLKESDKYLVEAKTLFEYEQYLLGFKALQKSNDYFAKTLPFLIRAKQHGKDIFQKRTLLSLAARKHIEVLQKMESDTPFTFMWSPEQSPQSQLHIHSLIDTSLIIRRNYE